MKKISSKEADIIFPGNWFNGYTDEATFVDVPIEVEEFEDNEGEFVIFNKGLQSRSIHLDNNNHSIYAINGNVEAGTMILGDAVFVINGSLTVNNWLFLPQTEGIFEVNGEQYDNGNENILQHITCPLLILFDRRSRETTIYKEENNNYYKVANEALMDDIIQDEEINSIKVLKRLQNQENIFKS